MKLGEEKHLLSIAITCAFALLSSFVLAKQPPDMPIASGSELPPVKSGFFDEFALANNVSLSSYRKIFIEEPMVTFDNRWLKDHRTKVSGHYKKQIPQRYGHVMKEQLEKAITKQGQFTLVDEKSGDTLILRINITDLDIRGPDSGHNIKTYVNEAGDATLIANIVNSNGKLLARFKDHRETRDRSIGNHLQRTSRVENQRDFRILMRNWSRKMVEHIAMN